jgi:cell wall-associated NlpC family hydrolase
MSLDLFTRHKITREAEAWAKARTPFIGGFSPAVKGQGADCASFIVGVLEAAGVLHLELAKYDWAAPWAKGDSAYTDILGGVADEVSRAWPGDICLFRIGRGWSHGGIVLQWPRLIHCDARAGVVIASANEGDLKRRAVRFFSLRPPKSAEAKSVQQVIAGVGR